MSIADKLTTIAENEPKIFEAGKQAEYKAFWDKATNNNTRTNYRNAFTGACWNDVTFNPPYTLKPTNANDMFGNYSGITKLTKEQVDFSKATNMNCTFGYYSNLVKIEEVDITSATEIGDLFRYSTKLETIEKLILNNSDGSIFNERTFYDCRALTNIDEIGGLIDGTVVGFAYSSNLTESTVINIFKALKNYSGTNTEPYIKMHSKVKTWLKEKPEIEGIATGKGWTVA